MGMNEAPGEGVSLPVADGLTIFLADSGESDSSPPQETNEKVRTLTAKIPIFFTPSTRFPLMPKRKAHARQKWAQKANFGARYARSSVFNVKIIV
jgi:hypothetical protein